MKFILVNKVDWSNVDKKQLKILLAIIIFDEIYVCTDYPV